MTGPSTTPLHPVPGPEGRAAPEASPLHVLVVDDDEAHVALAVRRLSRQGFAAAGAVSGTEALGRLQGAEPCDVVVLDVNMPQLDGLQTLDRVRAMPSPPPVVLVTGADEATLAVQGLKSGASDFIVKSPDPAYFDLLAASLRQAVAAERDRRARIRAEEARDLLVRELTHRVKNILAVVGSIAQLSSRTATTIDDFLVNFRGRISALSAAHDELVRAQWHRAGLRSVVQAVLAPHAGDRATETVPDVELDPQITHMLALALHELSTNAVKYGALSRESGRVTITGDLEAATDGGQTLALEWRELGGPAVAAPTGRGFGLSMIEQAVRQLGGRVSVEWPAEGLLCRLRIPLAPAA